MRHSSQPLESCPKTKSRPIDLNPRVAEALAATKSDVRLDDPLVDVKFIAKETGWGMTTIYRKIRSGELPPGFLIGPHSRRWRMSEIDAAIEALAR
jgi:predicted DNA-binding transcriptional regulator AlpA